MQKEIKRLYYKQSVDLMKKIRNLAFFYHKTIQAITNNEKIDFDNFLKEYLEITKSKFLYNGLNADFLENHKESENLKTLLMDFFKGNKQEASDMHDFMFYKFSNFWCFLDFGVFESINEKIKKAVNNIPYNKYDDELIKSIRCDFNKIDRLWKDAYDKLSSYILDSFFNIK